MAHKLGRRQLLRGSVGVAGASVLAACQPQVVKETVIVEAPVEKVVTQVIKETVVVQGAPQVVEKVVTAQAAPAELPKVYVFAYNWDCQPAGSPPEKLEAVRQYINEQTQLDIIPKAAPGATMPEQEQNRDLMLASGEDLDIFYCNYGRIKKLLMPLDALLEVHGPSVKGFHQEAAWTKASDLDGNIWVVPRDTFGAHGFPVWFRTDWLQQLGLEMPETWEEMETAIEAFRTIDPESVVAPRNLNDLENVTLGGLTDYGRSGWFDEAEKTFKPFYMQPGYRDWLTRMNEWHRKGWFHPESLSNLTGTALEEAFKSGHIGAYLGWYSTITYREWKRVKESGVLGDADYGFNPYLKGPKGMLKSLLNLTDKGYAIARRAKNPEACMQYLEWQHKDLETNPENWVTTMWGIPGTDWEWKSPDDRYWVHRLITECGQCYSRELNQSLGPQERCASTDDPQFTRHNLHIRDWSLALDTSKMPQDWDVPYDWAYLADTVPQGDLDRLQTEQCVKFISGDRPLSEFDAFLTEMQKAGDDTWQKVYTEYYLRAHPDKA